MYATGMRVSEVARLRFRDLDFDRSLINIWQGKGENRSSGHVAEDFRRASKVSSKVAFGR